MAGKLSPAAQQQIATLEIYVPRVMHLHSLIEQFAVAKSNVEQINSAIKRAAQSLRLQFMTVGLESMGQICGTIWMIAHRSSAQGFRTRSFREQIGSLKFQIELEIRSIVREDQELQQQKKAIKEAKAQRDRKLDA